ncbi:MAG: EF-hand domain-containing protein [Pseudomonadales bacterium]|jgi:hypothetical protein|nr:EF-hand domain-containing protein [Pseudomonadales bacterium]
MKTFSTMMTLATLCVVTLASNSYAQGGGGRQGGGGGGGPAFSLESLDTDKDGRISEAEFIAARAGQQLSEEQLKAAFARIDTNKDGYIDATELAARPQGQGRGQGGGGQGGGGGGGARGRGN